MVRAGVNPGGAYLALRHLSTGRAALLGLLFTSSGAFLEELLFRGIISEAVETVAGHGAALIGQALLFGAVHWLPMAVRRAPGPVVVYATLMPTAAGVVLGFIAHLEDSLMGPWVIHWSLNYGALLIAVSRRASERASA
jgi:membrane protease YdiL (CAAX protease family)